MKAKVFVLFLMMVFEAFNLNAAGINLKAKKTKETKVEAIYIEKISVTAPDGNGKEHELEGLAFLFEITKLKKNDKVLCMQELRDFNRRRKLCADYKRKTGHFCRTKNRD